MTSSATDEHGDDGHCTVSMGHRLRTSLTALLAAAVATTMACANGNSGETPEGAGASGPGSSTQGAGGSGTGGEGGGGAGEGGGAGGASCDATDAPAESECVLTDELGIFVRNEGDDDDAGTKTAPVRTIGKAIELAQAQKKRVYACAQGFGETLVVPAGLEIHGGLSCQTDWTWQEGSPTVITAASDQIPMRLLNGDGKTLLADLRVQAADASNEGGSSIAMLVDGATAELLRCELTAGNGKTGTKGADAPPGAASSGPKGNPGVDQNCDLIGSTPGGAAMANPMCPETVGGKGGDSSAFGVDGASGLPVPMMMTGAGAGGTAEDAGGSWTCATSGDGVDGANGGSGVPGAGAMGQGLLTTAGWVGIAGGDGTPGTPGQGGGGGGGNKGCTGSVLIFGDASGASGGAGGCGGAAGKGGAAGGSSIALISLGANLTLIDTLLAASTAGNGGAGGDLQAGGVGGPGGDPAAGDVESCGGGSGGIGGDGGNGGGGLGGHSIAIAYSGSAPAQRGTVTLQILAAGKGGLGGNASMANQGAAGVAVQTLEF